MLQAGGALHAVVSGSQEVHIPLLSSAERVVVMADSGDKSSAKSRKEGWKCDHEKGGGRFNHTVHLSLRLSLGIRAEGVFVKKNSLCTNHLLYSQPLILRCG